MEFTHKLAAELRDTYYHNSRIRVEIDDRDIGGARGWDWIKKGMRFAAYSSDISMLADSALSSVQELKNAK